jgi:GrpB-like predicted nucleotidyltransferase (UPF0157 family)
MPKKIDMGTLEQEIKRIMKEEISIEPYNPVWPRMFQNEKEHLLTCLPNNFIKRISGARLFQI